MRVIDEKVRSVVDLTGKVVLRAHAYAGTPVDVYHAHEDTKNQTDITAIYYPVWWEDRFGGELLFYDQGEPRWAVAVRTGRLIIFRGSVRHRVAPVSSAASKARCSLVIRYGEVADRHQVAEASR
jgi:Rps23 Pro-64 3,4-dihydroxylase Tpa1-like proline 4-hydroxylase